MLNNSYANVAQGVEHRKSVGDDEACSAQNQNISMYNSIAVDNNSHTLFIHNHDHPGLILIAKKLVGPDNYAPWSRSMQIALNARNKFVLVNGNYAKPDVNSPLSAQWERVNDLVITWILNSVAEEISDGLNYVTTASEVWRELHERFSGVNGHRIFQVMKDTHSLEQGTKSVEVYFHKLKGLWDEYSMLEPSVNCVCGAHQVLIERDQKRKLLQFLMGLHESNSTIRGQILMMSPLPSVSQAYAYVKQDEKARQGFQTSIQSASTFANATFGNSTNVTAAAPNTGFKKPPVTGPAKPHLKCSYCNFNGHTKETCYKLVGYPPNWKKKKEFGNFAPTSVGQFRPLPQANQANAAVNASSEHTNDQIHQMQQQINQISQMMHFFVGNGKNSNSPEDHLAGCS